MSAPGNIPPQRKGWRESSRPGTAASPGKTKAAGWTKKTSDGRYESAVLRHRMRTVSWSFLFLGLVGLFLYYVFRPVVRTPLVVYVATNYAPPIPPNSWASEDLDGLRSLGKEGGLLEEKRIVDFHDVPAWESKDQWLREIRRQIDMAVPGGPARNTIIIYLSLHGVVDEKGEPCVIPPGASPWHVGQWIRVRDLLADLFLFQDERGHYASKIKAWDKLLVLDCNRIDSNWHMGQLYNGFAERLPDVVRAANVPRLYVLNSASAGQAGWSAPEMRGSVFGYFLAQGLNGAADVESDGNHNKQISLRELYGYLRTKVNQWVVQNRDDVQEPMLVPEDAPDVPLVFRRSDEGTIIPDPAARDPRWDRVAAFWRQHAQLRAKSPYRKRPMEWEKFQYDLLRAEQLLQAGVAYDREFDETLARLTSQAAALDALPVAPEAVPYSLAQAEQWRRLPSDHDLLKLPAPWLPSAKPAVVESPKPAAAASATADAKPSTAKPSEAQIPGQAAAGVSKDAAKTDSVEKPGNKPPLPNTNKPPAAEPRPRYDYLPAAAVAWKRVLDHHETADDLKVVLSFVDGAENLPREDGEEGALKADVVEVQFLRMLAAYLDAKVWDRPDLVGRALHSRQLAEAILASPDLVTQYWIGKLVDAADGDRRSSEDELYIGSPDALKHAESLWDSLAAEESDAGKYREALRRAGLVSKALAVRDRAWSEGPCLAECLLKRTAVGKPTAEDLHSLLEATQKLAALLEDTPEGDKWPADLPQVIAAVEEALRRLETACDDESHALRTAAGDSHTLQRLAALLAVPWITGNDRNALREKCLGIMSARQNQEASATKAASPNASGLSRDWQARLAQWEKNDEHPALTLIDLGVLDPGEKKLAIHWPDNLTLRLSAQGEKVRSRLADLQERVQHGFQETRTLLAKKNPIRPPAIRQGCCNAERAMRASAMLYAGGPLHDFQVDPIAELNRFDLREMLLWQARRGMEDFWGPKPGADKPYFEILARDYLRSAGKLQRGSAELPEAARLEQLSAAAQTGVRPSVEPENLLVDTPGAELLQGMTVNVAGGLPGGRGAAFLAYSRGQLTTLIRDNHLPWRRMPIDIQSAGAVRLPDYLIAKGWETGSQWRAEALYRGHVRTAPFHFAPLRGVEIAFKPEIIPQARISVFGASKQRAGIIFIFDCSGSMGLPVDRANPASPQKLDVARNALCSVLDLLAGDKDACRTGVIVYGHRVWENDQGEIVTRNPSNLNELKPVAKLVPPNPALLNVRPDTDIEVLDLKGGVLAPLTEKRVEEIKGRLDKLNNMGMTPLYRAIMEAADVLNTDRESEQKHIIVLTDGVNDQRHVEFRNTCAQLREKLNLDRNKSIRLDIVGFQINASQLPSDEKTEYNEMTGLVSELKRDGRGDFFDAGDPESLLSALRKSLALSKFEVFRSKSRTRVCDPLELNKSCDVKPLTPGPFHVQLVDATRPAAADVVLDGGEWLELYLRQNPWGLVHKRYDREIRDSCEGITDSINPDRTFWIGAHLPKWEAGGIEFRASVQNGDAAGFSPRPCEAWVEITPLPEPVGPNEAKKYVFYDMSFQPDKPVPVLRCLAPRWPKQAEDAEIALWCKFRPTLEEEVPLGKLKQFHVSDVPDVRFDVATARGTGTEGACKVVINEWHPKGADIHRLKLELQAGAAGPVEVHRLFDSDTGDQGIVRHEFYLEGNPSSSEIDSFVVRIVSQARLKQGAVTPPRKLRVKIPK
jgi:hypothetical protein